jgi:hypothetical protein
MVKEEKYTGKSVLTTDIKISALKINQNLSVVRVEKIVKQTKIPNVSKKREINEYIINNKNLDKLLSGKSYSGPNFLFFKNDFIELYKKFGFQIASYIYGNQDLNRKGIYQFLKKELEKGVNCVNLSNNIFFAHKNFIFDLNNNVVPPGIVIDIRSFNYDISKAAKHLVGMDNVIIEPNDENFLNEGLWCEEIEKFKKNKLFVDLTKDFSSTKSIDDAIQPMITNNGKLIHLIWRPSQEEINMILNKRKETNEDLTKIMFDLDSLGLRKYGAAYFDDFWKADYTSEMCDSDEEQDVEEPSI